jgi:hypothetical protein
MYRITASCLELVLAAAYRQARIMSIFEAQKSGMTADDLWGFPDNAYRYELAAEELAHAATGRVSPPNSRAARSRSVH